MIEVSQAAAFYIRKHSPSSHISMASKNKNSNGKTYFAIEEAITFKLLKEFHEKELNGQL
jgi:hypothetical protein